MPESPKPDDQKPEDRKPEDRKPGRVPDDQERDRARRGRLGAVGVAVADVERSAAFYRATFGMVDVTTFELPHMREIVLGFENGRGGVRGAALVLMQYIDGSENARVGEPLKLVMYVADPVAVAASAVENGGRITVAPRRRPALGDALVGFVKDPDGNLLELLEA